MVHSQSWYLLGLSGPAVKEFLDALASLDFKLSLRQSVSNSPFSSNSNKSSDSSVSSKSSDSSDSSKSSDSSDSSKSIDSSDSSSQVIPVIPVVK